MSPHKSRLRRQKTGTPKRQRSPRTPKQRSSHSHTPSSVSSSNNSPQFPWLSQEANDGITWDYHSPLQLKLRSAKQHGSRDVNDLLKCIDHEEEKRQRTSLLDTWISAGQIMISPIQSYRGKPSESGNGKKKMNLRKSTRPRHLEKELQELSEAVKKDNIDEEEETRLPSASQHSEESTNLKTDIVQGLGDENSADSFESSPEELWGADSDSFLIRATQVMERAEDEYVNKQLLQRTSVPLYDINKGCVSCKDHTFAIDNKSISFGTNDEKSLKHGHSFRDLQTARDSGITDKNVTNHLDVADIWENDNSIDDILSSLSYDELTVKSSVKENSKNSSSNKHAMAKSRNNFTLKNANISTAENNKNCCPDRIIHERKNKSADKKCLIISDKKSPLYSAISSMKILQASTIEWESDEFDEVLIQAEILTAVEKAESEALGSQKCTPEEIARKKAEALERRRKKNNLNLQSRVPNFGRQQFIWKDRLRSKTVDVSRNNSK